MLIGEYDGKLTDKNRLAIPKKIRDELNSGIIVSRGYEGCLILVDLDRFTALEKIISQQSMLAVSVRDMKRFIMGSAFEIELDDQGRFVLPPSLRTYANIEQNIKFLGLIDWVEIWSEEKWQIKLNVISEKATDIAESIMKNNGKQT